MWNQGRQKDHARGAVKPRTADATFLNSTANKQLIDSRAGQGARPHSTSRKEVEKHADSAQSEPKKDRKILSDRDPFLSLLPTTLHEARSIDSGRVLAV